LTGQTAWAVTRRAGALRWLAFLFAWALAGALGLVDLIAIRQSVVVVSTTLNTGPSTLALIDKLLLLVSGLVWIAGVVYAQHLYSEEAGLGQLGARCRRVTLVELLVLAAAGAIPAALTLL
jgi:hypothetical protein